MSDALGPVAYGNGTEPSGAADRSEEEARTIYAEVRRLVDEAYGRARDVLMSSRETLDRVASALLERETLTAQELEQLAGPPAG